MAEEQFCLRWNNHQPNFISVFTHLLRTESLVDVTLDAEGKHLQAHRVVFSACSPYFQMLFTMNPCQHPIVILTDVKYSDMKIIVDFMYYGEVNISHEQLPAILKAAERLDVKGLPDNKRLQESSSGSGSGSTGGLWSYGGGGSGGSSSSSSSSNYNNDVVTCCPPASVISRATAETGVTDSRHPPCLCKPASFLDFST